MSSGPYDKTLETLSTSSSARTNTKLDWFSLRQFLATICYASQCFSGHVPYFNISLLIFHHILPFFGISLFTLWFLANCCRFRDISAIKSIPRLKKLTFLSKDEKSIKAIALQMACLKKTLQISHK